MNVPNMDKWTIVFNLHAGGGKAKRDQDDIESLLREHRFQYDLLVSEYPKHIIELTRSAIKKGARNFIAAGGDGTLNELVNGIFQQKICKPEDITLGMIPVGTGNERPLESQITINRLFRRLRMPEFCFRMLEN